MTDNVRIVRVPVGGPTPHHLLRAWEAFTARHSQIIYGNDDYREPLSRTHGRDNNPNRVSWRAVVVLDEDGRSAADLDAQLQAGTPLANVIEEPQGNEEIDNVVSVIWLSAEAREDTDITDAEVLVDPRWRVGAMAPLTQSVVEAQARAWNRPKVEQWTENPSIVPVDDPLAIPGVSSPFPGKGDPRSAAHVNSSQLLLDRGYVPAHTEWIAILDLDTVDIDPADALDTSAPDGHQILTWTAPSSPDDLREEIGGLLTLSSDDIPAGKLPHAHEEWTEDRLRAGEDNWMQSMVRWVMAAERLEDGSLGALTTMIWSMDKADVIHQEGTIVRADMRRQGMATRVKKANLVALTKANPDARRIYTWVNGDNGGMVATNHQLGFRAVALGIGWTKDASL